VLILIGGLVRATGSGMGCPDWPKCFGKLIPPTKESQLPLHYKEDYVAKRKLKNLRIATMMQKMGFPKVHDAIVAEAGVYEAEEFNATKTWIEYLNRLAGAIIGLFILGTCVFAWPLRKMRRGIFGLSILGLFLTFVQAFLGSIVVSTNLIPATVTFHMLFTIVMLWALMKSIVNAQSLQEEGIGILKWPTLLGFCLAMVQVLLGTRVRETVDVIKANQDVVADWYVELSRQNNWLEIHRIMAFVVFVSTLYVLWKVYVLKAGKMITFAALLAGGCVVLAMLSGILLAYFNMPAFAQPIHLTLGTLIVGCHLWIYLMSSASKSNTILTQPVI
jgi:cytochrome c oxidase assembly protein subunit 15